MNILGIFKKKKECNVSIISDWISKGNALIYPEMYSSWEKFVVRADDGKYFGLEVEGVLRIMEELATGKSVIEVIKVLKDDPVACEYDRKELLNRVFEFSKRGPEFYRYVMKDKMNDALLEKILEKENLNEELYRKYLK